MIKSCQVLGFNNRFIDVDLPYCNFGKIAESFGCYGEEVVDPNEIFPALERAKNSEKPAVIDVKIKFEISSMIKRDYSTL
jgi:thiamine pyrophosphate-dependent acetolactate synthase large subunit-like protein